MAVEYLPPGIGARPYAADGMLFWPYASVDPEFLAREYDRIPPDELAIRRGAAVYATDGHVGRVDEFLIDSANYITHLVLREGHLWGPEGRDDPCRTDRPL